MGVKDNFYLLIFYESSLLFIFFMKNEHFKYEDSKPLKVLFSDLFRECFSFVYIHIYMCILCAYVCMCTGYLCACRGQRLRILSSTTPHHFLNMVSH